MSAVDVPIALAVGWVAGAGLAVAVAELHRRRHAAGKR